MNTYKLVINGYTRNMTATSGNIADTLMSYADSSGVLRTRQYGDIHPAALADKLCEQPMYSSGRSVDIFNAPICALGGDFGTVTVS